jgi:hypothetical protein
MDRNIVYPGSIPLDSDLLSINRNAMIALGYLAQATLGTSIVADGLVCTPTAPASLSVVIGPGSITQLAQVDALAYGTLAADPTDPLLKMGINIAPTTLPLTPPTTSGQSIAYLIQASLLETDTNPIVLPYYNAANPAQPFTGPGNSGAAQNTQRVQQVQLQAKAGPAAATGTQTLPPVDNGWAGLYAVTVSAGQLTLTAANIAVLPGAPFLAFKLPQLRPGFASGVQGFAASGAFVVPAGVTQVEVEVWGGGAGSFASTSSAPSGGGAGGGYARRRIDGLLPGQSIPVTVGAGGSAGGVGGPAPGAGGTSAFGNYVSATGGTLNALASIGSPQNGGTGGLGQNGDLNAGGSAGQAGISNVGGLGGAAPMGGTQNSGTTGNAGVFPGGGASGAGTGPAGNTANAGAAGAGGYVIVRW